MQWHFYGTAIMFAISYCIVEDSHIRLDLFHRKFSPKKKEIVEVIGIISMLLPLYIILFVHGLGFVESALRVHERSASPLGLPYRWIIKSMVPLSMFMVIAAASSRLVRSIAIIFHKTKD
jgi:TRAP-type mannitol/chloroaromatic compound transport system permease small subunit